MTEGMRSSAARSAGRENWGDSMNGNTMDRRRWPARLRVLTALVLALAAVGRLQPNAAAQPKYGDLIVTGYQGQGPNFRSVVLAITPGSSPVITTLNTTNNGYHQWVGMQDDNRDLAVLTYFPNATTPFSVLSRLAPGGGGLTRMAAINPPQAFDRFADATGAAWDDQGRLVIAAGRAVYRFDPMSNQLTTVTTVGPTGVNQRTLQAVTIGPNRTPFFNIAHYLLNARSPFTPNPPGGPALTSYEPVSRTQQIVEQTNLAAATGIIYDRGASPSRPRARRFLATRAGTNFNDLVAVDFRTAAITSIQRFMAIPQALTPTNERTVWIALQIPGGPNSVALEVDTHRGTVVSTVPIQLQGGFLATGIERYGSNMLTLQGQALLGVDSPLFIGLTGDDPALAGANYLLALSLESAPPAASLTIGASTVDLNLALDPLFLQSISNPAGIGLTNSAGILDPMGNAVATLTYSGPSTGGLNIYAAWVAYNGTSILRVSETEIFVLP